MPSARTGRPLPPRIATIKLTDLVPGSANDLAPGAQAEGLSFEALAVDGRNLTAVSMTECAVNGLSAHETSFRAASIRDCTIEQLHAPVFIASRSRFTDLSISRSRLGSAELYDTRWKSVEITHSKLGFVNLRGAELVDVRFESCTIDELDIASAKLERTQFVDCRVGTLSLNGASLSNVDLRGMELQQVDGITFMKGATISELQLALLAPLFAEHLGIAVNG